MIDKEHSIRNAMADRLSMAFGYRSPKKPSSAVSANDSSAATDPDTSTTPRTPLLEHDSARRYDGAPSSFANLREMEEGRAGLDAHGEQGKVVSNRALTDPNDYPGSVNSGTLRTSMSGALEGGTAATYSGSTTLASGDSLNTLTNFQRVFIAFLVLLMTALFALGVVWNNDQTVYYEIDPNYKSYFFEARFQNGSKM